MKPQTVIPWCDSRRQYCAAGCSIRPGTHSGNCDWSKCIDPAAGAWVDDLQPQPMPAPEQPRPAHRFGGRSRRFTGLRRQGQARF